MESELAGAVAQFGVAGLVAWMWLMERRSAAARERQVCEMHDQLMRERKELDVLVSVVNANTRALTALEAGQRGLSDLLSRVSVLASRLEREG